MIRHYAAQIMFAAGRFFHWLSCFLVDGSKWLSTPATWAAIRKQRGNRADG